MKKFLSIDFSTGSKDGEGTGYAFRDNNGVIVSGSIKPYTKGSNMWSRTFIIVEEIKKIIAQYELEDYHVVIEQPIMAGGTASSIRLANCNGYFIGAIDTICDGFTLIPNSKWCAYHLIKGRRAQRKEESIEVFKRHTTKSVPADFKDDNEADAFNILTYCESL